MTAPLTAALSYEQAVAIARQADKLTAHDVGRLLNHLACYQPGLFSSVIAHLVAEQPELTATALTDLGMVVFTADVDGDPDPPDRPARCPRCGRQAGAANTLPCPACPDWLPEQAFEQHELEVLS